jgi:hypothetical protein
MSDETFVWFVGVDWGSEKHQVCILDQQGTIVGASRMVVRVWPSWATGCSQLLERQTPLQSVLRCRTDRLSIR